jgi:hypothetical protein
VTEFGSDAGAGLSCATLKLARRRMAQATIHNFMVKL